MSYNKSRHVDSAQKYLHQDKVAQAIAEYQNILKHEPRDQVTLMTIGDLYVRQGETFQALEYFERLAKLFLADGFVTKAIAIYKKIAKLAPEETRPVERLAELYVQQGVLSEARPIYLHLADVHERAGRQPEAAALLRKLLDAEPDNLRVQTRLAEMLLAIGKPGEAVAGYLAAAEQVHRRGDHAEAVRYSDVALKIRPNDVPASTLKARALAAAGRRSDAETVLRGLPELEGGGEAADLLLDFYLEAGELENAGTLATKIFARNSKHFVPAQRVAAAQLETENPESALTLLGLVRESMTDAGEHESLSQMLIRCIERLPALLEPREWLVELYGRASDSFRLPDALANLAAAYEAAGQAERAQKTYEQLLDRDPENEGVRRNFKRLQGESGVEGAASAASPLEAAATTDAELDEETQLFVTQSLTDVDLFSSYGLTQKAIDLLEIVRQRVPRHTPTLERLLDLSLGAGDERRTAELAAKLEQIHSERGDTSPADRYAELRSRFERASGSAKKSAAESPAVTPDIPVPADTEAGVTAADAQTVSPEQGEPEKAAPVQNLAEEFGVHEIDLSEEWAALSEQLDVTGGGTGAVAKGPEEFVVAPAEPAVAEIDESNSDGADLGAADSTGLRIAESEAESTAANSAAETAGETSSTAGAQPVSGEAPLMSGIDGVEAGTPDAVQAESEQLLELSGPDAGGAADAPLLSADDFLNSLSSELDVVLPARHDEIPEQAAPSNGAGEEASAGEIPETISTEPAGPLTDVFDEFRAGLDESDNDEDPETHYNLGTAYREMGLVEESISEFQKVVQWMDREAAHHAGRGTADHAAAGKGRNGKRHVFRYPMQCLTLLGLAFMDKGESAIAAMWYARALETPGLDQDSILALRYDLGVAQELAGDSLAARRSFSQVYGMNIDYRDVAERLAALGKG
jgi:tetratricopeptide (TPR) repeat protein